MSNTSHNIMTYEFPAKPGRALLRELILYIADKCQDHETFSATSLNKILYFSDIISYVRYGEPITGVCYQNLPNGPAPMMLVSVREEMLVNHDIVIRHQPYFTKTQHRWIALRDANLDGFSARDIALVDEVIDALHQSNAAEVSMKSHGYSWKGTVNKEKIPYNYAFILNEKITDLDIALTEQLERDMEVEASEWE